MVSDDGTDRELFADGIGAISFRRGVVRIDLVSLPAIAADSDEDPAPVFRQRVIMPPEGFLQAVGMMQGLVNKLVEGGVVKHSDASLSAEDQAASETVEPAPAQPRSPNFPENQ